MDLLKRMMKGRRRPIHLVLDGLPAHKTRGVRDDVDSLKGRLTLHFLPGDAPDLNPDELVSIGFVGRLHDDVMETGVHRAIGLLIVGAEVAAGQDAVAFAQTGMQRGESFLRGAFFGDRARAHAFHQCAHRQCIQALTLAETSHRITTVAGLHQQTFLA